MKSGTRIGVVIPALDEEAAIGRVIDAVPGWVDEVVVVDNGCTDATAAVARAHGARVVEERRRGYGTACLAGIAALRDAHIIVFLDGDFSDTPEQMARLVDPIIENSADFVVGKRMCENGQPLNGIQRAGNALACRLINGLWRARYSDLGPFRAIRRTALEALALRDRNFGWTVEMQIKAVRRGLRVQEVPTSYRRRIGRSKISGTLRGAIGAGAKILFVIFRNALQRS
jgi:hypothetical protein